MASLSRQLAGWVAELDFKDLPPAVVDRAKDTRRDPRCAGFGVAVRGFNRRLSRPGPSRQGRRTDSTDHPQQMKPEAGCVKLDQVGKPGVGYNGVVVRWARGGTAYRVSEL